MIIHFLTLFICLLFININAYVNKAEHSAINIPVIEHGSSDIIANDPSEQSWQTTTEKTLIRVTRLHANSPKPIINDRQRREFVDEYDHAKITEEIWGMAKKVAITIFILVPLCIICCIITTIFICVKCCCSNNNKQKRNQSFTAVQQPIVIHTGSSNYQPQFQQQQQQQAWHPENHPMLPPPSAPPQSHDDFHMERPPPYEQICRSR